MTSETMATFSTSMGDIRIRLFPNHAPKTVRNFVELAEGTREWTDPRTDETSTAHLYDGTIFHRVISGFMIQGGDPMGEGFGGPGYQFDDEIHPELRFTKPYLLAMANSGVRGGGGTNGSQFFITVSTPSHLNGKHTIFGEVMDDESKKVVDAIATVPTKGQDRPVDDVVVKSVTITRTDG
ncbi:peptidylprolyl isomerase [Streptomyces lavendulae]|uniref:peptidylprolyl isomerase n=1 Tax=Streptomyces lavendulae TaxID=1914 RepID=UPI003683FA53